MGNSGGGQKTRRGRGGGGESYGLRARGCGIVCARGPKSDGSGRYCRHERVRVSCTESQDRRVEEVKGSMNESPCTGPHFFSFDCLRTFSLGSGTGSTAG